MSIVRALGRCEDGRAILTFRNDTSGDVTVTNATAGDATRIAQFTSPLLTHPLELTSGESVDVDVSDGLAKLFGGASTSRQEMIAKFCSY